jgi:hypothetical protein
MKVLWEDFLLLVAVVKRGDDQQREADGGEQSDGDERVEQREAGAGGRFVGVGRVGRRRLGIGLLSRRFGVRHGCSMVARGPDVDCIDQ